MALRKGKYSNQYDFSGGINISQPGYLIDDNECYASASNYDNTVNCFWDRGIKRRDGTQKANSVEESDKIVNGTRFYRSENPEKTTIVAGDTTLGGETKLFYLGTGDTLIEISSGGSGCSAIANGQDVFFTSWKDKLYIAGGDTVIQVLSYSGGWQRKDISGLTYAPQYIVHHRDRLWAAAGEMPMGYLECSGYDDDESWASGDGEAFNVGYKDGDPITQLLPYGSDLIVYKNDSIWVIRGDNLYNWFQDREEPSVGCVAPMSAVDVGFGHIFLSADNVYFFDGKDVAPIGNKIKPWLDAIPDNLRKKASGTYHNSYYRLSFASSNMSTYNDMELMLDLKYFKSGKISWWLNDNRNISAYINYNGPDDGNKLYMCDGDAGFVKRMEIGNLDDGDSIEMQFHTKYFVFKQPNVEKMYGALKVDNSLGIGDYTLGVIKNLNDAYVLNLNVDASGTGNTFGTAILGTNYWTSQDNARATNEYGLPSELDGYSMSYLIKHKGNYDNVSFYGFSLSYAYKAY